MQKVSDRGDSLAGMVSPIIGLRVQELPGFKENYGNASIVGDDRVVFNIMGNKFRLVVRIAFEFKAVQIKWFGTHADYDKVDVTTIQYKTK